MGVRVPALLVALALLVASSAPHAQNRPLPDQEAFLKETRKHLERDSTLQSSYVYLETQREQKLDKNGRVSQETVKVYENYPGLPGEDSRWERLISENGRPVPAEELAKQDRERQKKATEIAQRLTKEPVKERARYDRDYEKARRDRDEAVTDIFTVFDIKMLGREIVEGHDTIHFSLTPRPDAKPKTREGGLLKHFRAQAWVSESDHELVKIEAEAIDDLKFGLGIFAKLHKGARLSFLRRKINGEVWMPAVFNYKASARVSLVVVLRRGGTSEFSNYRKYSVDTSSSFSTPSSPE